MRRYLPRLLVIGLLSVFALPRPCAACECVAPGPPEQELGKATAVFRGRVAEVSGTRGGTAERRVTFEVSEVWKGPAARELVVGSGVGTCGYEFTRNDEYIVYAYGDGPSALSTDLCRRIRPIANAGEDLRALGPGTAIAAPARDGFGAGYGKVFPLLGAIVVGLLTAGLALLSRRGRMQRGAEEALRR